MFISVKDCAVIIVQISWCIYFISRIVQKCVYIFQSLELNSLQLEFKHKTIGTN